jgi:hypothetical protein
VPACARSYLQYSLIAAQALRGVLKEEFKAAALRREGPVTAKFAKWEGGKALPSSTCAFILCLTLCVCARARLMPRAV